MVIKNADTKHKGLLLLGVLLQFISALGFLSNMKSTYPILREPKPKKNKKKNKTKISLLHHHIPLMFPRELKGENLHFEICTTTVVSVFPKFP